MQAFLSIVDRLIELAKRGEERRHRELKEVIEPLFKELEVVAQDYFSLFRFARDLLAEPGNRTEACKLIRGKREEMLLARIKLREMAESLSGEQRFTEFSNAIRGFFYSTTWCAGKMSAGHYLCDLFEYIDGDSLVKEKEGRIPVYLSSSNTFHLHFKPVARDAGILEIEKGPLKLIVWDSSRKDDIDLDVEDLRGYLIKYIAERRIRKEISDPADWLKLFGKDDTEVVMLFVEDTIISMENNWARICHLYSVLRGELH